MTYMCVPYGGREVWREIGLVRDGVSKRKGECIMINNSVKYMLYP